MNNQLHLVLKWTLLVWLNAAFSFFIALSFFKQWFDVAGGVCAVFTFVALYALLDNLLIKQGNDKLRKSLLISVVVKTFTQLLPVIELTTGILSIDAVQLIALDRIPFLSMYLTTFFDGLLLSLIVMLFMLIGKTCTYLYTYYQQRHKTV